MITRESFISEADWPVFNHELSAVKELFLYDKFL